MRLLTSSLLVLLPALAAWAQQPAGPPPDNVRFERLTVADGLPDRFVRSVHQDRYGFLWLATQGGLARYDGKRFTVYEHDPADPGSLDANWVNGILETRAGELWLWLGPGGADRLDRASGGFAHPLAGIPVVTLFEDGTGEIWAGTAGDGVYRLSAGGRGRPRHYPAGQAGLASAHAKGFLEDGEGRLWIATCGGAGLHLYDREADAFTAYHHDGSNPASLGSDCVQELHSDPQDRIWARTKKGLHRLLDEDGRISFERHLQGQDVWSVAFEADGRLWTTASRRVFSLDPEDGRPQVYIFSAEAPMGRANTVFVDHRQVVWIGAEDGLYRYHRAADRFEHYRHSAGDPRSLAADPIDWFFEDRSGTLWLGTRGHGVSRFARSRWKFLTYSHAAGDPESLSHDVVKALAEGADGTIWVGTLDGLNAFDPLAEDFRVERHDPDDPASVASGNVSGLAVDAGGGLWVATANRGLDRRTSDGGFVHYRHDPDDPATLSTDALNCVTVDGGGAVWTGGRGGALDRLDPATGKVRRFRVPERPNVWAVHADSQGRIWAGTTIRGLFLFDPRSESFTQFVRDPGRPDPVRPSPLNNRSVHTIFEDTSGRLWAGTFSAGLALFDEERGAFEHLTTRDGLPANGVRAIVEDESGLLWLGTSRGLVRFDPERRGMRVYDRRDGLAHDELSRGAALATRSGELYFGGPRGLARFRADAFVDNPHVPPVVLTGFRRSGEAMSFERPLAEVDQIELDHDDRIFSFQFAALDFAKPEKNRYAYRLEGFDDGWVDGGTHGEATYTNIDPDEYVFRVKASNNDGVWNEDGLSIRVRILPPFWATWWFRLLLGLAAAGLLAAGFQLQRRRLVEKQRREIRRRDHLRKTEELEYARRLQLSMLPGSDLLTERLEVVGRMRTATEVGGDFYDFLDRRDDELVVAVGDAIGHGTAAGLLVGMVKAALRHELRGGRPELPSVLAEVNTTLCAVEGRHAGMGLALVCLEERPEGYRGELASVAMPHPYYYSAAEEGLFPLELGGLPLGMREPLEVKSKRLDLEPGDALVLLSDGLAERLDGEDEVWGYAALEEELLRICRRAGSAADVAEMILAACDAHAGGREPGDDMTVVVVHLPGG